MSDNDLYIGLISGTSVDGVDCVLVSFDASKPELIASHFEESPASLRDSILMLCEGTSINLPSLGDTDVAIGKWFAGAVNNLLAKAKVSASDVRAIGSHGQTIWHQPAGDNPFSMQIGNPNTIAQLTRITTVADFRQRDLSTGGQGAPLAPLLHREVFQSDSIDRAVINIGGIGNVTMLPANAASLAFDTGPGNVLMDYWIGKHQQKRFDEKGEWAATGSSDKDLLHRLLNETYFALAPPKSTGRELFSGPWLERKLGELGKTINPADVQATLVDCTVNSIADAISGLFPPEEIYVCGGGAHNELLMNKLESASTQSSVFTTSQLGIDPDWVEAIAFAWMAKQTIEGKKIDTSSFTGASEPVMLGGIYPV
ncbi:MAG: anhydro-N-acetylmuramic acid kinase [Pseudomonadales bacterium]|nr:anhydro-N-acetylmuramic acid kinase [Pseudomonadales bacterium]